MKYLFLILFIILFVNFKRIEKFTREKLVYKCFNDKQLNNFKEYEDNFTVLLSSLRPLNPSVVKLFLEQ